MKTFGQRFAGVPDDPLVQVESIDDRLKNKIWSAICVAFFDKQYDELFARSEFSYLIYTKFFGKAKDEIDDHGEVFRTQVKALYQSLEWYVVYELIVVLLNTSFIYDVARHGQRRSGNCSCLFHQEIDECLRVENSAYRILDKDLVKITNDEELKEIGIALKQCDRFSGARQHIKSATGHYSNRKNPDYKNSIKEAISAVESASRIIIGSEDATLGKALSELNKIKPMHGAFKDGMNKLYGYASDEGGIRHAAINDNESVDEADARYMLITCSAFVNFIIARYADKTN